MFEISVIICTHNPNQEYLRRVIEALQRQTVPINVWELIIVDNASRQPVSDAIDISWHMHGRCVVESKLGLSSARHRGIQESTGSLLVFVDDDNVLSPDYLAEALRIATEWPCLGAWGSGSIAAEFEVPPAEHLRPLLGFLGVRDAAQPIWSNAISCTDATPIGAGLCIRRPLAEAYLEFCRTSSIQISGRKGSSLGAHEDYEMCYLACKAGLGMAIFPELRILHLINKQRVSDAHMLKLIKGVTASNFVLDYKWKGAVPASPFSIHGLVSFLFNLVRRRGFDRRVFLAEQRALIEARRVLALATGQ